MTDNLEERKRRLIFDREYAKSAMWYSVAAVVGSLALLVLVFAGLAIWYGPGIANAWTHSLKASADQTEHITATAASGFDRLDRILAGAEPQINEALTQFVEASRHANGSTQSLDSQLPIILSNLSRSGAIFDQGSGLIADLRQTSLPRVNANLDTLNANQQVMGKTIPTLTGKVGDAIGELQTTAKDIRESEGYKQTFLADGSLVHLNRSIQGFEPMGGKLGLTFDRVNLSLADANRISKDSADKWHSILWPEPCKTFGCRLQRGFGYVWRPASEGLRIYQQLNGLPVNLMQPIRIQKQQ